MIFRGPEKDVAIPDVALTPFLLEKVRGHEDEPAFIEGPSGRVLTFGQWASAVRRASTGLHARGLRKGDVVAILSPNVPEYAVALHAVSLAGGITTTMNPIYTATELGHQLDDSHASYVVTVPEVLEKAREASAGRRIRETFVFGEAPGATPFAALTEGPDAPPEVHIDPRQDVVVLPYSSGTTGLPKGVMLTHRNLVANILQCAVALPLRDGEAVLGVLPFFHIYGLVVIMNLGLYKGAATLTMPRFDLEQCLGLLQQHRVSYAYVVPPIALALAKHPLVDKFDLSALKTLFSGAAPLGEDIARQVARRLGCKVFQGYGLTETSPATHAVRASTPGKLASVGSPVPNTESKVVDLVTGGARHEPGRRDLRARAPGHEGLPGAARRHCGHDRWRRLAAHGGHRVRRRGRLLLRGGPTQGADQVQGAADRAGRAGGGAPGPPVRGRRCGHPRRGRGGRTDPQGLRGAEGRIHSRRDPGLRGRARRPLQEAAVPRVHGSDPEVGLGQDPPAHPGRAREVPPASR